LLTVHPLQLFGKHEPPSRHFFKCSFYGRVSCFCRALLSLGCFLTVHVRTQRHTRRTLESQFGFLRSANHVKPAALMSLAMTRLLPVGVMVSPDASVGGPTAKIGRPWTPVGRRVRGALMRETKKALGRRKRPRALGLERVRSLANSSDRRQAANFGQKSPWRRTEGLRPPSCSLRQIGSCRKRCVQIAPAGSSGGFLAPSPPAEAHQARQSRTSNIAVSFERGPLSTRWRRTGWLRRQDSNLCISESDPRCGSSAVSADTLHTSGLLRSRSERPCDCRAPINPRNSRRLIMTSADRFEARKDP
jgi:hypothetical protein